MSTIESVANAATSQTQQTNTKEVTKKGKVTGKTIGNPQLSEKGAKYYEELKKKYSDMDFILVSRDQKKQAQAQAGNFANPAKTVVLIDEDKIEKMAEDEKYRKQYEGIINNARNSLEELSKKLSASGANVKGYGITINDHGMASFFAVVDKSLAAQKERIEKNAADKKDAKKAEEKKAAKEKQQERLKGDKSSQTHNKEDLVTVTANSINELMKKINDVNMAAMSDWAKTDEEKQLGQSIDFRM